MLVLLGLCSRLTFEIFGPARGRRVRSGGVEHLNVRWWHSHGISVVSLVTAILAVGVLTALVIRQQQGQPNGHLYLETSGTLGAKPLVPPVGLPKAVGGTGGSAGAPIQPTAGPEAQPVASSRERCACANPPAPTIQPKVQASRQGPPQSTFRPQRMVVSQPGPRCARGDGGGRCYGWNQPRRPNVDGPLPQPKPPDAGPPSGDMQPSGKLGPSGDERSSKLDPSGEAAEGAGPSEEAEPSGKLGPAGAPTPRKG